MKRYAEIARAVAIEGTDEECMEALREKINEFNRILDIPTSLKEFGVPEEEFFEKLPSIAEHAVGDACTGSNPREITPKQMEDLFTCIYHGEEVNF